MRRLAFAAALAVLPGMAAAQDWATRDVCTVESAEIVDAAFDPPGRAALESIAAGIENRRGRFWRIEAPDGAVSYLWGTFRSSDALILNLPQQVRTAISEARVVAVAVDNVAPSREAYRASQYPEARYNTASDPFMAEGLGDGTIAGLTMEMSGWVRERAIELGWTEDADLILSPAGMAEMLLSDPCEDFSTGVLPMQDDYVQLLGRLVGARILGLETPEEFLNDLSGRNETASAIIAVLAAYLKPVTTNAKRKTGFALYREGRLGLMAAADAAYLDTVLGQEASEVLALKDDYMLTFRNYRFVDRLKPELDKGGVVVALGARHIAGETGMVSILRKAGYDVTRVVLPGEAE